MVLVITDNSAGWSGLSHFPLLSKTVTMRRETSLFSSLLFCSVSRALLSSLVTAMIKFDLERNEKPFISLGLICGMFPLKVSFLGQKYQFYMRTW